MYLAREAEVKSLSNEQWRKIDSDEFISFIIRVRTGRITLPPRPPQPIPQLVIKVVDPVAKFKKGNKRFAVLYPMMRDH